MKGSKTLQKAGEQKPKACEFQGKAEGVVECEEFHIAAGPTPKFMAKFAGPFSMSNKCLMTPTSWHYLSRSKCIRCPTSRY